MSTVHVTYSLSTNVPCPFKCFYPCRYLVFLVKATACPSSLYIATILQKIIWERLWYEVFSGTSKFVHPGTVR